MQQLNGRPVTTESILAAIDELNSMAERKLSRGVQELKVVMSSSIRGHPYQLYCESTRLSMDSDNTAFKTLDLSEIHTGVETFGDRDLSEFLDLCASFMNVEESWPSEPSARKVRTALLSSSTFLRARVRIGTIVSQVVPPRSLPQAGAEDSDDLETV